MRVGVVLACLVMTVRAARGRELLEPLLEIVDETVLPIVDVDTRGDVHGGNQHHALEDAACRHDRSDLVRDADELRSLFGFKPEIVGVDLHAAPPISRLASALKSSGDASPRSSRRRPAAAIIAALSVDSDSLGTNTGSPSRSPRAAASRRSRLFADTPPAMPMLRAPRREAASNVRST